MGNRLDRLRTAVLDQGLDAVLVTPGPDLRYLTGYDAKPLERLTCLVVRPDADPVMIVPLLERSAAEAAGVDLELRTWGETDDPFAVLTALLPEDPRSIGVDDHMWAARVLELQRRFPRAKLIEAGGVITPLRAIKSADEVDALRQAGSAIDRVHRRMGEWLQAGRTEREVARDIGEAIIAEGHERVDFIIVGSGPNGASPHHEVSDRVINPGEPVVVDIGGTTARGYCSDSTRNYVIGEAPQDYLDAFAVLLEAQERQVAAVRPGIAAQDIDRIGRAHLAEADLDHLFIHRTGHGIGQETHEEPYIVEGNDDPVQPGAAFSVEPGVYAEGRWGARIEDIVVVTAEGAERLNHSPRDLVILP